MVSIKRFMKHNNKTCEVCDTPHKNRNVNRCNVCRIGYLINAKRSASRHIKHAMLALKRNHTESYYMNKTLNPGVCPTCGTKYTSTYSLRRHAGRSNKCRVIALENIISELTDLRKDI